MSKIQRIEIKNFKAISHLQADFNGCTAIVTAGNNKGKTSFLRGIADRIRFIRPEAKVKEGEEEGKGELLLTDGTKFIWDFDNKGKDKLEIIIKGELKKQVTRAIGNEYFPDLFDIDRFLQSTPKEQIRQLQKIVGIDFTEIDARYQKEYDKRTALNQEAEKFHVKLSQMLEVPKVDFVDLTELTTQKDAERERLNDLYKVNTAANLKLKKDWESEKEAIDIETKLFNEKYQREAKNESEKIRVANEELRKDYEAKVKKEKETYNLAYSKRIGAIQVHSECHEAYETLLKFGYSGKDVKSFIEELAKKIEPEYAEKTIVEPEYTPEFVQAKVHEFTYPPEPEYPEPKPNSEKLDALYKKIQDVAEINVAAGEYKKYIDYKRETEAAKEEADNQDKVVIAIEKERKAMIAKVKFPKGVEITTGGYITVDGFALDRNVISTSKLYIAALRIAAMNIGSVRCLYFDASFLDNISLNEIMGWAIENDLQLLIERPDMDGGEITYTLIEH